MTQLKTLTLLAVQAAMNLLIESNGKTTTLETKLLLRDMGFDASQSDVSAHMNTVFNAHENVGKFKRELVGPSDKKYHEYSFEAVASDGTSSSNNTNDVINTPGITINGSPKVIDDGKEMPKFYIKTSDLKNQVSAYKHKNDWLVNKAESDDDDQCFIFDGNMTRDKVRSRFATLNKMKINGVRARRISNVEVD